MTLDPSVAAVRLAVRRYFGADWGDRLLVACSGGADSLALLAACVFEGRKAGVAVVGVTVDHGLQEGSAEHTARVVEQMAALGVDETASIRVTVDPGSWGIEAGAREARYAALAQLAEHFQSRLVLLGHTLDDQAETVLLGLARGSGGRSLQGMRGYFLDPDGERRVRPPAARPDPGPDRGGLRGRGHHLVGGPAQRRSALHPLAGATQRDAGARGASSARGSRRRWPGPATSCATTWTSSSGSSSRRTNEPGPTTASTWTRSTTSAPAIRSRCIRRAAIDAGAIPSELTHAHVRAVAALLGAKGKEIQLPGHVTAYADGEVLRFRRTTQPG